MKCSKKRLEYQRKWRQKFRKKVRASPDLMLKYCLRCYRKKEPHEKYFKTCFKCRIQSRNYALGQIAKGLCRHGDGKKIYKGGRCYECYTKYEEQSKQWYRRNWERDNLRRGALRMKMKTNILG